jgi:hypothetical protein
MKVMMKIVELNRIRDFTVEFAVVMIVVVVKGERIWWFRLVRMVVYGGYGGLWWLLEVEDEESGG